MFRPMKFALGAKSSSGRRELILPLDAEAQKDISSARAWKVDRLMIGFNLSAGKEA